MYKMKVEEITSYPSAIILLEIIPQDYVLFPAHPRFAMGHLSFYGTHGNDLMLFLKIDIREHVNCHRLYSLLLLSIFLLKPPPEDLGKLKSI